MFWPIVIAIVILFYIYSERRDNSPRTNVGTYNEPAILPMPTYKQRIKTPRDEEPPLDQIELNEDFIRGYDSTM